MLFFIIYPNHCVFDVQDYGLGNTKRNKMYLTSNHQQFFKYLYSVPLFMPWHHHSILIIMIVNVRYPMNIQKKNYIIVYIYRSNWMEIISHIPSHIMNDPLYITWVISSNFWVIIWWMWILLTYQLSRKILWNKNQRRLISSADIGATELNFTFW